MVQRQTRTVQRHKHDSFSDTTGATSFRTEAQETIDKITNKMTIEFFAISACGESDHIIQ